MTDDGAGTEATGLPGSGRPGRAAPATGMRRRRRTAFVAAVVVGLAALVGGVVVAWQGYAATDGPAGAARSYYAALAAGDAPRALAWTAADDRPLHTGLLTSAVLREQQAIAPLRDLSVTTTDQRPTAATVRVRYTLMFAAGPQPVNETVGVIRRDGGWRLSRPAARLSLAVNAARRATVLGRPLPTGAVDLFPGALPIRFDSPYLRLAAGTDRVTFAGPQVLKVRVEPSAAGVAAVRAAVGAAVNRCLAAHLDGTCPLPDERAVPGSFSGRQDAGATAKLDVTLADGPDGRLEADGAVRVTATYQSLDFTNRAVNEHGDVDLDVRAQAYAVAPLRIGWRTS